MWPSVSAGKSFVGVGLAGAGKTVGYLVPVVNYLLTGGSSGTSAFSLNYPYPSAKGPNREAPLAIIVSPNWKKAVHVSEILDEMIKSEDLGNSIVKKRTV